MGEIICYVCAKEPGEFREERDSEIVLYSYGVVHTLSIK